MQIKKRVFEANSLLNEGAKVNNFCEKFLINYLFLDSIDMNENGEARKLFRKS